LKEKQGALNEGERDNAEQKSLGAKKEEGTNKNYSVALENYPGRK